MRYSYLATCLQNFLLYNLFYTKPKYQNTSTPKSHLVFKINYDYIKNEEKKDNIKIFKIIIFDIKNNISNYQYKQVSELDNEKKNYYYTSLIVTIILLINNKLYFSFHDNFLIYIRKQYKNSFIQN